MRIRSLVAFWVLAVVVSWGAGSLVAISTQGSLVNGVRVREGALPVPFWLAIVLLLISGAGPTIAAIAVCAAEDGARGVRALLGQVLRWRTWPGWYAVALALPTVVTLVATVTWSLVIGARPDRWLPLAPAFQLIALPILPWGEEIGWRGFAQPRLQARWAWQPASVVVGLMWGLWHQWPLLTPAAGPLDLAGLGVFFVYIVGAAVLIGWVYDRGGRRLPLGWAGHAGLNAVGQSAAPFALVAACFGAAAVVMAALPALRPRPMRRPA